MAALINMYRRQCTWSFWKAFCFSSRSFSQTKTNRFVSVESILNDHPVDTDVKIQGWIKSIRKQKENTFLHIGDGISQHQIQVIIPTSLLADNCSFNSAVEVVGRLVKSPKAKQPVEVQGSNLSILGPLAIESFPFAPRRTYPPDYLRHYPHLRAKTDVGSAILRLSSRITSSLQSTLLDDGYINVFTPILTSNDCEGSGEVFTVRPASDQLCNQMASQKGSSPDLAYFDKQVYLTVSGQLHLEAIAGALPKVFTLGSTFRAENSRSRRHLAEFRMLEAELAFCDNIQSLLPVMEHLIKRAAQSVLENSPNDLALLSSYNKANIEESLTELVKAPFATLSYKEGMELLLKNAHNFKSAPQDGQDLGVEHELFLVQHTGGRPTFVIDWPANIKPFYMRTKNEDSNLVSCVDLLVPRVGELCGGSLRENRYDLLKERLVELKLDETLGWYLDLRKYGGAPTGGFGLGLERLIAYLLQIPNVKDVVPFPRTPHQCPM